MPPTAFLYQLQAALDKRRDELGQPTGDDQAEGGGEGEVDDAVKEGGQSKYGSQAAGGAQVAPGVQTRSKTAHAQLQGIYRDACLLFSDHRPIRLSLEWSRPRLPANIKAAIGAQL
jgi:hypothetical protein